MFDLFDIVKIKSNGVIGTIIDKTELNDKVMYIVENNAKGEVRGAYGGKWAEFDCRDEDLVKVG